MTNKGAAESWPESSVEGLAFGWVLGSEDENPTLQAPHDSQGVLDGWSPEHPDARPLSALPGLDSLGIEFGISPGDVPVPVPEGSESDFVRTRQVLPSAGSPGLLVRDFPSPGDLLARFRIITELGRGAFARVYLAEQIDLDDRPVALKVAANLGDEPRNLARLQHTHIVPIYSVHDDAESGWRLICMPYVGGANLSQILRGAGVRMPSLATGRSLIEALDRIGQDQSRSGTSSSSPRVAVRGSTDPPDGFSSMEFAPPSTATEAWAATRGMGTASQVRSRWGRYFNHLPWWKDVAGIDPDQAAEEEEREPARRYLRSATYIQASTWIIARLAEALQHAHERGLVHRDLKPSNILIAADGTPMLLDFNLSADVRRASADESRARAMIGGTLPYMSPEHLDAFSPEGTTPASAVGPAADIYSLGLILFEMVCGEHPFSDPPPGPRIAETTRLMREERLRGAPSARAINPNVPWGLESILSRCLAPEPADRYARAGDFAEDLRRLLDDRPLKYVPEPSLREVVAKWARRNPRAASATNISALAIVLLMLISTSAWVVAERLKAAEAREQLAAFDETFSECQFLLNTSSGPDEHLDRGMILADAALASYGLRDPATWKRPLPFDRLPEPLQQRLSEQLSELIALRERARIKRVEQLGPGPELTAALTTAVRWLDQAERIDPSPSFALFSDRAAYRAALGDEVGARADRDLAAHHPPTSARDMTLLGTALLARGEVDRAEAPLVRAVALDARRFWSWFALALCHFQQGRYADAAGEFGVCSVLAPDFAWPNFNRGLALAEAGRLIEARIAYDQSLLTNPDFLAARVNRGLLSLELGDPAAALGDLERALKLGRRDAPILAARAEALSRMGRGEDAERDFAEALRRHPDDSITLVARGFFRLGVDPERAEDDLRRVLAREPDNARAHLGMAYVLRPSDPVAALAHLDRALTVSPNFSDALQLRAILRGRLGDPAAEADVERLERVPTAHRLYNAACALARLHESSREDRHARRALDLLRRAIERGFSSTQAEADPDFDSIRDRAEFRAILGRPASRTSGEREATTR